MVEQSQLYSAEDFPCFQRIVTFLANSGLHSYSMKFSWFDQKGWRFYPFTHSYNQIKDRWFGADDEATLYQQEQASLDANIFVANVFQ